MRMSAKAEYAVRAMTQLAAEPPGILIGFWDEAEAREAGVWPVDASTTGDAG